MRKFNVFETVKRNGKYITTGAVLGASLLPSLSQAAVDEGVNTAMNTTIADIATVGALVISAAVASFGVRWIKAQFF